MVRVNVFTYAYGVICFYRDKKHRCFATEKHVPARSISRYSRFSRPALLPLWVFRSPNEQRTEGKKNRPKNTVSFATEKSCGGTKHKVIVKVFSIINTVSLVGVFVLRHNVRLFF